MFCKFCGQEMADGSTLCESCGKENPAEGSRVKTVLLAVGVTLGVLAVGAVLLWLLLSDVLKPKANDVQYKDSYYVNNTEANANRDKVVATMGQHTLTNGQLQVFYWMQFIDYVNTYGGSGFDYTQPLDSTYYDKQAGITYQQYFLEKALNAWEQYAALTYEAELAGYQLPEAYQEDLDTMRANMEATAEKQGYENVDVMLQEDLGAGVSFADYEYYLKLYYYGNLYFSSLIEDLEATVEEMESYYAKNEAALKGSRYEKGAGKLVDMRHVLVRPKGTNTDGTYTEEEWEACRQEAQRMYDNWLAEGDITEESFSVLAQIHSVDGNAEQGGIYEGVYKGQMVTEFDAWCFDENRKPGDHGIVKTQFGYHLMYFIRAEEGWVYYCEKAVINEKTAALLEETLAGYEHEAQFKDITMGMAVLKN